MNNKKTVLNIPFPSSIVGKQISQKSSTVRSGDSHCTRVRENTQKPTPTLTLNPLELDPVSVDGVAVGRPSVPQDHPLIRSFASHRDSTTVPRQSSFQRVHEWMSALHATHRSSDHCCPIPKKTKVSFYNRIRRPYMHVCVCVCRCLLSITWNIYLISSSPILYEETQSICPFCNLYKFLWYVVMA